MILSHVDYCNAHFHNVSDNLAKKLPKVLYAGFGFRGSALRLHMLPFLKFRINRRLLCSHIMFPWK